MPRLETVLGFGGAVEWVRASRTADSENRTYCAASVSLRGFQNNALSRQLVVEAVLKLIDEDVLGHHRVCCVRVGSIPDQLDVGSERIDSYAPFLTPEVKPLPKLL